MKKLVLFLTVSLVSLSIFSYEQSTITVCVFGVKNSDIKENSTTNIEIEIYKDGETSDIANTKVTESYESVISALLALEIPEGNIIRNNNHSSHFNDNSFYARKTINVVIPAELDNDKVYTAVIEAGATGYYDNRENFGMIPPQVKESGSNLSTSLEEAASESKTRAVELAKVFNAQVGRIVSIRDLNYGHEASNEFGFEVVYELIY